LLRDELDELAKKHPDQFKVWYTVDKSAEGEKLIPVNLPPHISSISTSVHLATHTCFSITIGI